MRNSVAQSPKGLAANHRVPHPTTEELLRALVDHAVMSNTFTSKRDLKNAAEEIIVDAEVEGVRYLVIRLPRPTEDNVSLSPREQEIVRMVAQGHPNKVIADVLNISSWTVCTPA